MPCLMITKIMILIILCHFSSCIILHATKVACKLQRYRDRGCWQLLPTSCHFSSTKSCKHMFSGWSLELNKWVQLFTLIPSILPLHGSPCRLPCLLPVTMFQCPYPFLSAILTSGRWWSVSICYLYFRD